MTVPAILVGDLIPLLGRPLPESEEPRVQAQIDAMMAVLAARYGDRLSGRWDAASPLVMLVLAKAVNRLLSKQNEMAESESAGPFSVRWGSASTTGDLFLAGELTSLDVVLGRGGTRTVRTRAPDGQRFGNVLSNLDLSPVSAETVAGIEVEPYDPQW